MSESDICISVFGLGYVGCVTAACFSSQGYRVIGVDINPEKVETINMGKSPIIEKELEEYIADGVSKGLLKATVSSKEAVKDSNFMMVSVGTPTNDYGDIDLNFVERVSEEIGIALKDKNDYSIVIYRSTVVPGTIEDKIIPILEEKSGKKSGVDFGVCFNPEFLREGVAVDDFFNPPKIVIGEQDKKTGDLVENLYKKIEAPLIRTDIKTSEMVKYVDNIFHALKVTFANEIGIFSKSLDIESHKVMEIFCKDYKLNISSYYLKPGFAFGGSCLPKDLRAFLFKAGKLNIKLPVLSSILLSNEMQIKLLAQRVVKLKKKKIGILGLSFKADTDDFRESPLIELTEFFLGKGYKVKIYDRNISLSCLIGANKEFILKHIPHISSLIVDDLDEIVDFAEVIIVGNKSEEFVTIFDKLKKEQIVIDLVRITENVKTKAHYEGIYW